MVRYEVNGPVDEQEVDQLFSAVWPNHAPRSLADMLDVSLTYAVAYPDDTLGGFVRVLECGRVRGFAIGSTAHPDAGDGVGTALFNEAAAVAKEKGLKQLHVELPSKMRCFCGRAGFRHTAAGRHKC
ncbi:MAG: GNAT family N-acetyltransferase [Gemmatimonadales bacterium]|jgi:GNAT superfamily N-acetyltransferase|nr:GNAT family N-acetyltransferase [Gemmatimonadales bacterium]MDG2240065.1 GNAT family N-acetyltransferase [Longimicrobiales bacterium]MBT3497989.1 GNAT family N-acetyltransferase [Gemmatimonadales bacterium]MBT3774900.1 GNAT family N-acetyltransferase [Gemmatimonadales bacterium]MBT3959426.1 GNAT family N-acetyltransferase [Gemmatimonadales bacterium]